MDRVKLVIKLFWLEILVGGALLMWVDDIRWFLFFLFVELLFVVTTHADYLRKMIRVFQVSNEIKLLAVTRKLKVTEDEISIVSDDVKRTIGENRWAQIEKELQDLSA